MDRSVDVVVPPAEVDVSEPLVRRLLADQHADLAHLSLRYLDEGWDNAQFRLGDELVVRLPRRKASSGLVLTEQRWLPVVGPVLPLVVPIPVRVGVATTYYPLAWSVVPWIEGEPGDLVEEFNTEACASRLAHFLGVLHRPAPADAPANPVRGVPLERREATLRERLAALGDEVPADRVLDLWDRAMHARAFDGAPVWVHGDLHPANLLFSAGTLCAVLDFGDLCAGDPATDGAAAWMLLTNEAVGQFWREYPPHDLALEERSKGWAVLFGLIFVQIGLEGRPSFGRIGRATLERLFTDAS